MSLLRHSAACAREVFLSHPRRQYVVFVILLNQKVRAYYDIHLYLYCKGRGFSSGHYTYLSVFTPISVFLQNCLRGFEQLAELFVAENPFTVHVEGSHIQLLQTQLPQLHVLDGVRPVFHLRVVQDW